jgi:hypothetical protein
LLAFQQEEADSEPLPGADSKEPTPKLKHKTYKQDWPTGFCTSRFIRWFGVKYGVTREKAPPGSVDAVVTSPPY